MDFRDGASVEHALNKINDRLNTHESMIFSLQTIAEKQQELIERMSGRELKPQKRSLLENIDMEKLVKIAVFAAALYTENEEDTPESKSI
ncbi:MAG: hypothetical protein ACQEUT_07950 [Bacillota bacterium]